MLDDDKKGKQSLPKSTQAKGFVTRHNNEPPDDLLRFISELKRSLPDGAELVFSGKFAHDQAGWPSYDEAELLREYRKADLTKTSFYVGMSGVSRDEEGNVRNRKANFVCSIGFVLDDVGTKGVSYDETYEKLPPTAIIESSKGNYQFFYLLKVPCDNFGRMKRLVSAVYKSKFTDGGGALTTKYVRLPVGVRNKVIDDAFDDFPVRLVELNGDVRYTIEDLEAVWPPVVKGGLADDGTLTFRDSVAEALKEEGLVNGQENGQLNITCPWADQHTSGTDNAAYWPIGVGSTEAERNRRGYKCHHEHCAHRTGEDVAEWLRSKGYFVAWSADLEVALQRYALVQKGSRVADLQAGIGEYALWTLNEWQNSNMKEVKTDERQLANGDIRDVMKSLHVAWLKSTTLIQYTDASFDPSKPRIYEEGASSFVNTYIPLTHPLANGKPDVFLRHCEHVIPDEFERELFYDWLAHKVQHPALRSYMLLMVADAAFGVGRSMIGDTMQALFKGYAGPATYGDLTGDWGGWMHQRLMVVINEIKDRTNGWKDDVHAYEKIKDNIDTKLTYAWLNIKYGGQFKTLLCFNVLAFSNHINALKIPVGDRRVGVITNNREKRTPEEYRGMQLFINDTQQIANLWHWLMQRDVTGFNHVNPPMTEGKRVMIAASASDNEAAIEFVLDHCGDIVSERQLVHAAYDHLKTEYGLRTKDDQPPVGLKQDCRRKLKTMKYLSDDKGQQRQRWGSGIQERFRIVRNVDTWFNTVLPKVPNVELIKEAKKSEAMLHPGWYEQWLEENQ